MKTPNLANQPPSGGMPASEKRNTVISDGQAGCVLEQSAVGAISPDRVLRATAITTAKAPRFMAA